MTFLFWGGLFFLIGFALCIHFDACGIKTKVTDWFLSVFGVVLPDGNDENTKELKLKMAKAATFIAYAVLFVFLVSVLLSFALPYSRSDGENTYTGPLGDLFNGLLTPLLTFLTFCGLLITIMIQNVQMKSTLQELELTRKEMSESTDALQEQVKNSIAQKFDSNFYEMLKFHMTVIDNINEDEIQKEIYIFNQKSKEWNGLDQPDKFRRFFLINYQLLKFIKSNEDSKVITENQAKAYANIIRSMLSESIYGLIFMNSLSEKFSKYKELIEHYEFLEHFALSGFSDSHVIKHISEYKISVFGNCVDLNIFLKSSCTKIMSFVFDDIKLFIAALNEQNSRYLGVINYGARDSEKTEYFHSVIKNYDNELKERLKMIDHFYDDFDLIEYFKDLNVINKLSHKNVAYFWEKINYDFKDFIDSYDEFHKITSILPSNRPGIFNLRPINVGAISDRLRIIYMNGS